MKKTLLLSLALGMGLCANAEKAFVMVSSADQFEAGGRYKIVAHCNASTWGEDRILTLNGGFTQWPQASTVTDEESTIWTLEATDGTCTYHGTPTFYVQNEGYYMQKGNGSSISSGASIVTVTTPNAIGCAFEFCPMTNLVATEGLYTWEIHVQATSSAYVYMAINGSTGSCDHGTQNGTASANWYPLNSLYTSHFVVYKETEISDPREAYTAQYTAAKSALENELIGEGLNQYSFNNGTSMEEWRGYAAELEAAWTAETFDAEAFEAVIAKINAAAAALTLNMPEDGSYIRIRTSDGATAAAGLTGNWYLGAERVTYDVIAAGPRYMTKFVNTPDASTIFYYSNGYLLNLSTGFYMSATSTNHLHPGSTDVDGEGVLDNPASKIRFQAGHNSEQGVYQLITSATNNGIDRACHNHVLSGQDFTSALVTNSCGSACGVAHNINIEYVSELEFTMGKDGMRSICLPVDLTVADGFEGFTAEVENNVLTLSKVDVIPANTPALLKGAAEAMGTFTYTIPEPVADPAEKYATFGKIELAVANVTSNNVASYDGAGIAGLLDDNSATFFHSHWQTQATHPIADNAYGTYLEVALPAALNEFGFMVQNRNHAGNNPKGAPQVVHLYGSNDGATWTKIAEVNDMNATLSGALSKGYWGVNAEGLEGTVVTTAPYTDGNAYTKLRFCVMEVGGGEFTTDCDVANVWWACAGWELWGANTVAAPAQKPAATAAEDGATAVHGHTAVAQRTAAEGNVLLSLSESATAGKAQFAAIEGDVMPAHAMVVEAKEAVTALNFTPADGVMIDLTTGQELVIETLDVTLNSGNATGSENVGTSALYFYNQTSSTDPAITMYNGTSGIQNNTGNNRFIIQDGDNSINNITVTCEKKGYYISEIEISAMDGGFNGDEFNFYMTDGSTQMTQHSASTFTWSYDYDEATASKKTIEYNKVATTSFKKNLYIYYVKVTLTKLAGTPAVDYTPIIEALAAKAAILTTVKESVPGSETDVDEFIAKYAELSPEAIATQAGGVDEGVALINSEFASFMTEAEAKLPEWVGGKNVTLKNVRRNEYACALNAGTTDVTYNTIAEPDQSAVWQFNYEPEATTCVLYNLYSQTYAAPNEGGYSAPVADKADATEVTLELADNGRLLLYTEGAYGYLCFDTRGNRMAYWMYDAGCDWQAAVTDIQVSPVVGLEEINAVDAAKAQIYDLQGRRVYGNPTRGLYIINGRKQIVK